MTDLFFEYFSDIILVIGITLVISLFFIYRNRISVLYNSKILFLFVLLYFLYWIPQGFDITDEGNTLSKSWFMFHGMWHENINMIWGSIFVNGIWLKILGVPNVLWARIGYSILMALISVVSYKILVCYFEKKSSFLFTFLITIFIPLGYPQTINYHNLPTLFVLLSFLFLSKGVFKKSILSYGISGLFLFISIMLRFPLIIFLLYPFLYFLADFLVFKRKINQVFNNLFFIYSGVVLGVFIFFIFFILTDSLEDYFNSIFNKFDKLEIKNPQHSINYLSKIYFNDFILLFKNALISILFILTSSLVFGKVRIRLLKAILIIIFAFGPFYYLIKFEGSNGWVFSILGFVFSSLLLFVILDYKKVKKYYTIIFYAVALLFLSFLGSNNGIRMHIWSGTFYFFGSVFLLLLWELDIKKIKLNFDFKSVAYVFIIFIIMITIVLKPVKIYRDQSLSNLTGQFKSQALKGIKSTPRRIEVSDSLISFIDYNYTQYDKIMVVGTMPMIYFLTNKRYILKDLWRQPEYLFKKYMLNNKAPEIFVFSKINPRNKFWPYRNSETSKFDSANFLYYKNFVDDNNYTKEYENYMFKVYRY